MVFGSWSQNQKYWFNRFAQPAGPGSKLFRIDCFFSDRLVSVKLPRKILLGELVSKCASFPMLFHHFGTPFGITFATLGSLLTYLGFIFWTKKQTGAPKVPLDAQRCNRLVSPHLFGHHFGVIFWRILDFSQETHVLFTCVFHAWFIHVSGTIYSKLKLQNTVKSL